MREIVPKTALAGLQLGCVLADYYHEVSAAMLSGFETRSAERGLPEEAVTLLRVPGAVEIPIIAQKMAQSGRYDAIVAFGLVVRGETAHFEHVAGQCAQGCQQVALSCGIPVVFAVLTTYNLEQAWERVGGAKGHVGREAVDTALHMVGLVRELSSVN